MENRIKLLFARLTILSALLALGVATYYFNLEYSLSKSFQLGTLVALGTLMGAAIIFFTLSLLLVPIASRLENNHQEQESFPEEKEARIIPREERIVRYDTKEEYLEQHSSNKKMRVRETQAKLKEMAQEQGTHAEVMLVLPLDLSYLLAKESISALSFGKIGEENEETGTILGTAGFGSSPQEIKLTIRTISGNSTAINILSKSPTQQQSDKKNLTYIKKIFDFLRKKEKFYTEY